MGGWVVGRRIVGRVCLKIKKEIYYYHFVGHCGAFYGLKWRIWRAKMYFSPLKGTNEK